MYQGSCLCGDIHYEVHGELGGLTFCHCKNCQKVNGTAFLAGTTVNPDEFKLDDPNHYLKSYESSQGVFRYFCGNCASPLYTLRPNTNPVIMRLRVGTLDTPLPYSAPDVHIFCDEKAHYLQLADNAPKHHQGLDSPTL